MHKPQEVPEFLLLSYGSTCIASAGLLEYVLTIPSKLKNDSKKKGERKKTGRRKKKIGERNLEKEVDWIR